MIYFPSFTCAQHFWVSSLKKKQGKSEEFDRCDRPGEFCLDCVIPKLDRQPQKHNWNTYFMPLEAFITVTS